MAEAVAIGLFIGCLPLYGLHLVLCLLICVPLRLDTVLAYLVANISNPLVAPFLIALEVEVGSLLLMGRHAAIDLERVRASGFSGFVGQVAVGAVVVGGVLAVLGGSLAFVVARWFQKKETEAGLGGAIQRTIERYRGAPIGDRIYVASKLQHDPVFSELARLPGAFGRVLDAGAGRGQLGLCLLELGRATTIVGFDGDDRKVRLAQAAGRGQAEFRASDFATADWPASDTVLLIDVLHYLPSAEQDAVLAQAVAAVPPGGRVLVRELDGAPGLGNTVTRSFEWLARGLGLNRGRSRFEYRRAEALLRRLEALGCSCAVRPASQGTPFANVLIVAQRK